MATGSKSLGCLYRNIGSLGKLNIYGLSGHLVPWKVANVRLWNVIFSSLFCPTNLLPSFSRHHWVILKQMRSGSSLRHNKHIMPGPMILFGLYKNIFAALKIRRKTNELVKLKKMF